VVARVEATSLRRVAEDIGMSKSGLTRFIGGAEPYSKIRRKLERWYVRSRETDASDVSVETARAALAVLLQDLRADRRGEALQEIAAALHHVYGSTGHVPPWLREILTSGLPPDEGA
jgi:DNA-binding MurR/RpiR family transcriptional regulator